jgi:[ribosomal protein S18]-alanine N-acetyltransferase
VHNPKPTTSQQVAIRKYHHSDFDNLWRLDQQCFEEGIAYTREELQYFLRNKDALTLVATRGQEIMGFILSHSESPQNAHIITIDVHPDERRSGLGTRLMTEVEAQLRDNGCEAVLLEVAVDNFAAISFYKRHGYSVLKTIPRYYKNSLDALLMAKELKSVR